MSTVSYNKLVSEGPQAAPAEVARTKHFSYTNERRIKTYIFFNEKTAAKLCGILFSTVIVGLTIYNCVVAAKSLPPLKRRWTTVDYAIFLSLVSDVFCVRLPSVLATALMITGIRKKRRFLILPQLCAHVAWMVVIFYQLQSGLQKIAFSRGAYEISDALIVLAMSLTIPLLGFFVVATLNCFKIVEKEAQSQSTEPIEYFTA